LPLAAVDSNPDRIIPREEAIQLAYGTSVVLLRFPFVPAIMYRRVPEVLLNQKNWKVAM
jgi:hypothetical protein